MGFAFVQTCNELEINFALFGDKGVNNSFYLQAQAKYTYHYVIYSVALSPVLHHISFSRPLSSAVLHRHAFNYRVYLTLGSLRNTFTQLMYSQP